MPLSRAYIGVSWVPLALWIAANAYVARFEGWGAWAAAPILLVPLAVSLVFGIVGLGLLLRVPKGERWSLRSLAGPVLAWIPVLQVVISAVWRELTGF